MPGPGALVDCTSLANRPGAAVCVCPAAAMGSAAASHCKSSVESRIALLQVRCRPVSGAQPCRCSLRLCCIGCVRPLNRLDCRSPEIVLARAPRTCVSCRSLQAVHSARRRARRQIMARAWLVACPAKCPAPSTRTEGCTTREKRQMRLSGIAGTAAPRPRRCAVCNASCKAQPQLLLPHRSRLHGLCARTVSELARTGVLPLRVHPAARGCSALLCGT